MKNTTQTQYNNKSAHNIDNIIKLTRRVRTKETRNEQKETTMFHVEQNEIQITINE